MDTINENDYKLIDVVGTNEQVVSHLHRCKIHTINELVNHHHLDLVVKLKYYIRKTIGIGEKTSFTLLRNAHRLISGKEINICRCCYKLLENDDAEFCNGLCEANYVDLSSEFVKRIDLVYNGYPEFFLNAVECLIKEHDRKEWRYDYKIKNVMYIYETMNRVCIENIFDLSIPELDMWNTVVKYVYFDYGLVRSEFGDILDCLIYDLLWYKRFHKEGLYPKEARYLSNVVSSVLSAIDTDYYYKWELLNMRKMYADKEQELEHLNNDENLELDKMTNELQFIIKTESEKLRNDMDIRYWINVIKSYRWKELDFYFLK